MASVPTRVANDRSFRRGAIMGLTIAESFILLIFCLLLLFFFWQAAQDRREGVRQQLSQDPELDAKVDALVADGSIDALLDLRANGIDIRDMSGFAQAEDYWRFISEPELRRLMDGAVKLEEPELVSLADSVAVPAVMARLRELEATDTGAALDAFLDLTPDKQALFLDLQDQDLGEVVAELPPDAQAILSRLGPDGILALLDGASQAEATIRTINASIAAAAEAETQLIDKLQTELGDDVRNVGGEIRADGTIILPENVVFEQGEAAIKPALRDFLESACSPWIGLLKESGLDIGTAEIQGHASREWRTGTTEDAAFRNNLELSQTRARNVLNLCLSDLTDPDLAAWARAHLVAVGYSSGRPILVDGVTNDERSRRVEFSFRISREDILDAIQTEVLNPAQ